MTPAQHRNALQRVADDAWPGAGIEVSVQVWRSSGACHRCGNTLEARMGDDGQLHGDYLRTSLGTPEMPIRTIHSVFECQRGTYGHVDPPIGEGDHNGGC